MGEIEYTSNKSKLASQYIEAHPDEFIRLTAVRLIRFWTGTGTRSGSIFFPLHAILTTAFGFAGLWMLIRQKRLALASLFLLPLILFPFPYYITHAEFRYRVVIDPLLTLLAAYAASLLLKHLQEPPTPHTSQQELIRSRRLAMQTAVAPEVDTLLISPVRVETPLQVVPIIAVTITARLAVIAIMIRHDPRLWFFKEATELAALAQSLLAGNGLSSPFGGTTGPSAFLAPGYPALVALVFRFFGSYSAASALAIMLLQVLFSAVTVAVIMLAAQRAFGSHEANIAGAIWAISPSLLWLPAVFWETSLSTMLLVTMFALALRCAEQPALWIWITLGLGSGVALLVNPALALALAAILVWSSWNAHKSCSISLSGPATATLLCLLIFAPWSIRNLKTLHAFIPFRSNLGYELWQGNRPGSNGFFSPSLHPNTSASEFNHYASLGEIAYMREKSTLAEQAIRANPVRFIRLTLMRFDCFWTDFNDRAASPFIVVHIIMTTFLGLAGLLLMIKRRLATALLFSIPLSLFPLPYYLTHPDPRFRLVIDPIATILAAYAIVSVESRLKTSIASTYR